MSTGSTSRVTLANVIEAVGSSDLQPRRKQELVASVRTVARVLGREPAEIIADPRTLSVKLRRVAPIAVDLSIGRWNNVRSHLRAALELVRPMLKGRSSQPMEPAWLTLFEAVPTRSDRYKLSRPLRWLSGEGIGPESVTRQDLDRYRSLLVEATLIKDVDAKLDQMFQVWNRAARNVPGWPQVLIERAPDPNSFSFDWSVFPANLKADVDRWLARLSGTDLLDEDAPIRPLRGPTLKGLEYGMRAFASALVHRGRRPEELVSIGACLMLDNFKEGLRFFLDRRGGVSTRGVSKLADSMKAAAKHWVKVDAETLKEMDDVTRRLAVPQLGMTQKNRERLIATNDPEVREKLMSLPWTLQVEVIGGKHGPKHRGVLAQMAVAIAIQLVAPLRVKNLASLEIGRHLVNVGSKLIISIPSDELKNRANDLVFEMPAEIADLIRWYIEKHRTADITNRYLFPGAKGGAKAVRTLQTQIQGTVHAYTGLDWNVHLFRHFGAKQYLDARPGEYEIVRRVLGHSSIKTTTNAYTGLETLSASRHFAAQVLKRRAAKDGGERRS